MRVTSKGQVTPALPALGRDEDGCVPPDFFIGAHAAVAGYRLMTRDTRRFFVHFPGVELVRPDIG